LDDAIRIALVENPTLKAAVGGVDAASGQAWQLGRWSNPSLDLAVEEWPVSSGGSFSDSKQIIGVTQQLPWPGKKKYDRALGKANVRSSQSSLALRRTEVTRDVKAAFHRVLASETSVTVGEELLRIAQSSADATRKRVDSGAASYPEQLRAEIQLQKAQSDVADLHLEVTAARQSLFGLLGRPDLADSRLTGSLSKSIELQLIETPMEQWQDRHPSHAAAEAALRRATLALRRARLEPYPDITAGVAGGRLGETDESIVEFGFSIPLPILDSSKGHKAEAAAQLSVAEAELQAVRQALQREWIRCTHRYQTAADQVAAYQTQILPKASEALRLVQTGFEEGKFGFMDLLDVQRTFAESQLAYQTKLLELNIAQAELEALAHPCPVADIGHSMPAPS